MASFKDLTGKRFGRLVVVSLASGVDTSGNKKWNCKCDCGKESIVFGYSMKAGVTKSCGCLMNEVKESRKLPTGESAFNTVVASYKRNAKERGLIFELSNEKVRELTKQKCAYCGTEPKTTTNTKRSTGNYTYNGIDRVDTKIGYVESNVVTCCEVCNRMKWILTEEEFYNQIKKIYQFSISKK